MARAPITADIRTVSQTVFVRLPPDIAAILRLYAKRRGQDVDAAARDLIISAMAKEGAVDIQSERKSR